MICESYRKSEYFFEIRSFLKPFYEKKFEKLYLLNSEITFSICEKFGLKTKFSYSSKLKSELKKSDMMLDICKRKKAKKNDKKGAKKEAKKDTNKESKRRPKRTPK